MTVEASAFVHRLLVACALAREAGQIAKRRFLDRSSFTVGFKGPQDYLTEVDGEVERFIATRLHAAFPEDGFIGEEGEGRVGKTGAPIWVVDPIDGTSNFARGAPHFCVSIAAVLDRQVEVGVIYDPMVDELFAGRRGGGATLNGAAIRASAIADLKTAGVEVGWNMRSGADAFLALLGRVVHAGAAVTRSGSGALALAYVAAGRRDGYRREPHQRVGLSGGNCAGARSGRLRQRFPRRRRSAARRADRRLRARPQGLAHRRRRDSRARAMTEAAFALAAGEARLAVARRGAEAIGWSVGGVELLWPGDPAIWGEISPILYPVVGWTRDGARVGGRHYPLRLHGFASERGLRRRDGGRRFRPADASRQREDARALPVRVRIRGRISPRRRGAGDHARGRQSRRRAGALRLRPPSRLPLAVRRG